MTGPATSPRPPGGGSPERAVLETVDELGRLGALDAVLRSVCDDLRRAAELAARAVEPGALEDGERETVATEADAIRARIVAAAGARHEDRPLLGGLDGGANGGTDGGADGGADAPGSAFLGPGDGDAVAPLTRLAAAVRSGDVARASAAADEVDACLARADAALAEVGRRAARVRAARQRSAYDDAGADADADAALLELQVQEVAYRAALGAAERVLQPSLLDFLR